MSNAEAVAGKVMASVMSLTNEDGESIAERMSVADLWLVIERTVQVILTGVGADKGERVPGDLSGEERLVWFNSEVRTNLRDGKKIQAIKEARSISGLGLKESKDLVERMETAMGITLKAYR